MAAPPPHPLEDRIYTEAGQWIRLGNTITWAMGSIFVPFSLGALAFAVERKVQGTDLFLLGCGSVFLYLLWLYVSWLYRSSVIVARQVAMRIEESHGVPAERSLYRAQGQPGYWRLGLFHVQMLTLFLLVAAWYFVLTTGK